MPLQTPVMQEQEGNRKKRGEKIKGNKNINHISKCSSTWKIPGSPSPVF